MLSIPLFKQSIKSNWGVWLVMTIIMSAMLVQFTSMQAIADAGLTEPVFYGMMATIIPSIYIIITGDKLLASQVDRGSMAYILSTPIKRSKVVITQALFFIATLVVMFSITTILNTITGVIVKDNITLESVLELNLGAFLVAAALSGICFMFSGIFNLSKNASNYGGLICIIFMMCNLLAFFANYGVESLEFFQYLTIVSLFDISSIMSGADEWIWKFAVLAIISIVTYTIGSVVFCKKDLPL